jgi:hypothetical protein
MVLTAGHPTLKLQELELMLMGFDADHGALMHHNNGLALVDTVRASLLVSNDSYPHNPDA